MPERLARSCLVGKQLPTLFGAVFDDHFPWAKQHIKFAHVLPIVLGGPIGRPCCYPPLVAKEVAHLANIAFLFGAGQQHVSKTHDLIKLPVNCPQSIAHANHAYIHPHQGWIAARAPNRLNSKNSRNALYFCFAFFWPMEKCLKLYEKGSGGSFPTNPDLANIWATRILILIIFMFGMFLDSKFPDFQVPRSSNSQISRRWRRQTNSQIPT